MSISLESTSVIMVPPLYSMLLYPYIYMYNYSDTTLMPTTSEQCLPSCPPTHLYIPRAPPPIHPLPPLMPWTQQLRPKPILAADFDIEGDFFSYCDNIIDEANDFVID